MIDLSTSCDLTENGVEGVVDVPRGVVGEEGGTVREGGGAAVSGVRAGLAEPRSLGPCHAVEVNPGKVVDGLEVHLGTLCLRTIYL